MGSQCEFYTSPDYLEYLVEYRGDFLEQINKVPYACGDIINKTLGIISVKEGMIIQLLKDVPAILFVDFRDIFVLGDVGTAYSPNSTSNIAEIKGNKYLNLTGRGVLVGIVDTGIDYLNEEFTREDGTSRIEEIWDQTIVNKDSKDDVFIGTIYNNIEINKALEAKRNNKDPYEIVPSKDTVGHGTQIASIAGARGYNKQVEGVAQDCNYVIVKLLESAAFKKRLRMNNIKEIPVYSVAEIISALEYLKKYALKSKKPMVIIIPLGSTEYTHTGNSLLASYINSLSSFKGIVAVTGTGNEGAADGHTSGYVRSIGDIKTTELLLTKEQKILALKIYINKPNEMTLNIIAPSGQESGFIPSKLQQTEEVFFVLENTKIDIRYYIPDNISGMQIILLNFQNIKPGVWSFQLKGKYITDGRYDIWLPPSATIPEGTKFLASDPYITLTLPSTTKKILSVAFYNQIEDSVIADSGKGSPINIYVKPDLVAPGVNILTTTIGNKTKPMSGASVATAIAAGCCALLFQWGIVDGNDKTMFATTVIGYLIGGTSRRKGDIYPNPDWGYGMLNLEGVFKSLSDSGVRNCISSIELGDRNTLEDNEYYFNNIFIRIPKKMEEIIHV